MTLIAKRATVSHLGLVVPLLIIAGCGGGGGGGTSVDPNTPVISNLRATVQGQGCTLPSGLAGRVELLTVDYTDADGNLKGGTFEDTSTPDVAGSPLTFTSAIPSGNVAITGTTSGTITAAFCLRFNTNTTITERVKVTDASGKVSNELSAAAARPAGAPLLPSGAGGSDGFDKGLLGS